MPNMHTVGAGLIWNWLVYTLSPTDYETICQNTLWFKLLRSDSNVFLNRRKYDAT